MNEQNLRPIRSKSEARELGRKGGRASGESRRMRRALKDALNEALGMTESGNPPADIGSMDFYEAMACRDLSMIDRVAVSMIVQALNGSVQAAQFIRDTIGEKPAARVEVDSGVEAAAASIEEHIRALKGARPSEAV